MSFRRNILASYASQIYVTLIGIFMMPFYVQHMGAEAYGLIGFFAMVQSWFQLLDVGLTPTMARETARFQGGRIDALSLRRLLRALEGIFCGSAVLGAVFLIGAASWIAKYWLNVQQLSIAEVERSLVLMAVVVALRWICGLYRGALNGLEKLVWLGGFNVAIATARFVLVIPVFVYIGVSPTHFFGFQVVVAVVELLVLAGRTYRLLPPVNAGGLPISIWTWKPLRGSLKFSMGIAFTSSIWVLVTQTDKLILSKVLPLADYGYFSLAVLAAGGVLVVTGPVSAALIPRMTRLNAEGNQFELIRIYRESTQLVAIIAISSSLVLAVFAEQVLWAWTGNSDMSQQAAPVLRLYALGNGVLALGGFPAYLQFAKGDLRLHVLGNAYFVLFLVPTVLAATWQFGATGAGYAWLGANLAYFLLWVPKVHDRFLKNLHFSWLLWDVGGVLVCGLCGVGLSYTLLESGGMEWQRERVPMVIQIVALGMLTAAISSCGSPRIRRIVLRALAASPYAK